MYAQAGALKASSEYRRMASEHREELDEALNQELEESEWESESEDDGADNTGLNKVEIDSPQEYVPHDIVCHIDSQAGGSPEVK